jgi:hypothetical protein
MTVDYTMPILVVEDMPRRDHRRAPRRLPPRPGESPRDLSGQPARGFARTSSLATATHPAPCIWRRSTGRPQLAMDYGCAPRHVFVASDQVTRPPCPAARFPAPECLKACAVPPKNSFRLNDLGRAEQAGPQPGHPNQQCPVTAAYSKTRRRTPQGDAQLVAKE